MTFAADFKDLCQDTATWYDVASRDAYGKPTYAAGVALASCRLVRSHKLVRDEKGDEVVSTAQLWILQNVSISPEDKVTLSDGTSPPIAAVERPQDETGLVAFVKVMLR